MKLRQKHPGAIRVAGDDMGEVVQDSPIKIRQSPILSSHFPKMCREAYSSQHELYNILDGDLQKIQPALSKDPGYEELRRCFSVETLNEACICSRQVWVLWYPCALKYCPKPYGKGEHRCGLKSCQKCLTFRYKAKSKLHCSWDEP